MLRLHRSTSLGRTIRGAFLGWLATIALFSLPSAAGATAWQQVAQAQCGATTNCILTFPAVAAASRLEVRHVGCEMRSTQGTLATWVRIYLQTKQGGKTIALDLSMLPDSAQYDGTNYYATRSETVAFYVPAQQKLKIVAWPDSRYGIDQLNCAVRGELIDAAGKAPYQATTGNQCGATVNCILNFPVVPTGKRLDIRHLACEVRSSNGATTTRDMRFVLQTKQNGKLIAEDLATVQNGAEYDAAGVAYSTVSQPVQFSVAAGQRLSIVAWQDYNGSADRVDCAAVGAMNDAATAAPYQVTASSKSCSATTNCIVSFPQIEAGRQLEVQFVACELRGTDGGNSYPAITQDTRLYLQTQQNGKKVTENITSVWPYDQTVDGTNVYSAVSQPVAFTVPSQQALSVFAWNDTAYVPPYHSELDEMDCTISGQLQ